MIDSQRLSSCKEKYPFLEKILEKGYGARKDLFELNECEGTQNVLDCITDGDSSAGGDYVSWRWNGIKSNEIVHFPSYKKIREALSNNNLDYLLCDEVLTIDFGDRSQSDRTISIYKIKGERKND